MGKLSSYAVATSIDDSDRTIFTDDPTGTAVTKGVAWSTVLAHRREYGQLYVDDNAAGQALTADTWTKVTQFDSDGSSNGTTPAHASDQITLTNAGLWLVVVQLSFSGGSNDTYDFKVALDGTRQDQVSCRRKVGTGGDVGSASLIGLVSATAGQVATLEVKCDASITMVLQVGSLAVVRVD